MCPAIVRRHDLDVLSFPTSIRLLILDADVRKVDLVIEVREVVLVGPLANLIACAIGVAVILVVVLVALVEPTLVLTLQLVVEDHAVDVRAPLQETRLGLLVCAIDLKVVFQFPLTRQARVEGLVMVVVAVPMALEQASAGPGQADSMIAVPGHARRLEKSLFTQVAEVTGSRIGEPAVVVAEVTTGDNSKSADGRERSRLGSA
jgi:hypothetical protein